MVIFTLSFAKKNRQTAFGIGILKEFREVKSYFSTSLNDYIRPTL